MRDAGDPAEVTAEEAAQTVDEPRPEDLLPYVEAAVADTVDGIEAGLPYARPGAPAHEYLLFQADHLRANLQDGGGRAANDVEPDGEKFQVCHDQGCVTLGGFVLDGDLVSDFEVNGNAVSDHMYPGGSGFSQDGASIAVARSYYSMESNVLTVILHGEADPGVAFDVTLPDYRAPDGERALTLFSEQTRGQDSYGPGESGVLVYSYPDVDPGGHMSLYLDCHAGCDFLEEIELRLS